MENALKWFHKNTQRIAWIVFSAGFLLYFTVNVGLALVRVQKRTVPIHADDSYNYILKAVEMATCFRQDCPALEDLRAQVTAPSADPEVTFRHWREHTRALVVYHPLHSALVVLAWETGLEWENAFELIRVAGTAFICLVMPYWLLKLWGPGPSGIARGLLTFTFFDDQGLHYIVPSNLALGIAMLIWARISSRNGAAEWSLILGVPALVMMHTVGRLYGICSILLFLMFVWKQPWSKRRVATLVLSSLVIVLSFVLPLIVSRPELIVRPDPPLANWPSAWYRVLEFGILANITEIDLILKNWIELFGSLSGAAILTALGFFCTPPAQRSTILRNAFIAVGLCLASVIYVMPHTGGELFRRVWIPLAIILTGATGAVAWSLITGIASSLAGKPEGVFRFISRRHLERSTFSPRVFAMAFTVAVAFILVIRVEVSFVKGVQSVLVEQMNHVFNDPWFLDPEQPKELLAQTSPSDAVIYLDEVPMHFYFTHGALQRRAVFFPALVDPNAAIYMGNEPHSDTPRLYQPVALNDLSEKHWLESISARFVVGWNPIQQVLSTEQAMIPLWLFNGVQYISEVPVDTNRLKLNLVNKGGEALIQLEWDEPTTSRTAELRVPEGWSGWLPVPEFATKAIVHSFAVSLRQGTSNVYLKGINTDDSKLNWPWGQRATLTLWGKVNQTIRFDPEGFLPVKGLSKSVRIVNDTGNLVLAELTDYSLAKKLDVN
jgi:hypothetical protein